MPPARANGDVKIDASLLAQPESTQSETAL
jgi:hypothetical protein